MRNGLYQLQSVAQLPLKPVSHHLLQEQILHKVNFLTFLQIEVFMEVSGGKSLGHMSMSLLKQILDN